MFGVAAVAEGVPGTEGDPLDVVTLCEMPPLFHCHVTVPPTGIVTCDGTNTSWVPLPTLMVALAESG